MLYGGSPYGVYAYADADAPAIDSDDFEAFLARITEARCWLLELDAFPLAQQGARSAGYGDAGYGEQPYTGASGAVSASTIVQRFASQGYISASGDTPAATWYDPRIAGLVKVQRQIVSRGGVGGLARSSAEIDLVNEDGALDRLDLDYALDGRAARILLGRPTDARADFGRQFSGVVEKITTGVQVRLRISDGLARLKQPVNPTSYAGTGDLEGGTDLAGKPKPYCAGSVYNVSPPLVDSTRLIYQVHGGAIDDVPNAWDRGVALTQGADYGSEADLLATAPSAGQYRVWPEGGCFRLGATPGGTVTCDVRGDASGSGYVDTVSDIVLRLLVNQAALSSSEVDPASFSNLKSAAGASVGIWVGAVPRTCEEVIDELLFGIGAWGGFNRVNAFTVGLVTSPVGLVSCATYTEAEIRAVVREPLPAELDPVIWRVRVGWQRNYTPQQDLASGVAAARRSFAAEAWRFAEHASETVLSRRRLAKDYGPIEAPYAAEADAETEAERLFDLWASGLRLYRVDLGAQALTRDLGDVVTVRYPRFGFDAGRDALVLGITSSGSSVELLVLA